ncbi:MAG: lipid-A-disaccharide synthase [Myxococcota bacterium]
MKLFVSTADASGDLHASALVEALRKRCPELEVFGLGGERLRSAGLEALVDRDALAIGGLVEVASSLPRALAAYSTLRAALAARRPDRVLLVDSPDLNLPLAAVARRRGLRVLYYIAPQLWAWRQGRARKLRRRVDQLGVIFPFEEAWFRSRGIATTFLGHPLVDRIVTFREHFDRARTAGALGIDPSHPLLALLPGSRRNELRSNLAIMLEAARRVRVAHPELQVALALASGLALEQGATPDWLKVVRGGAEELIALATCALSAAGTATLEAALLGIPTLILHRTHPLSFAFAQRVVRVPSASMLNLIAGAGIVPERVQSLARPAAAAALLAGWIRRPEAREAHRQEVALAARKLGPPGAVERAAEWVLASGREGRPDRARSVPRAGP